MTRKNKNQQEDVSMISFSKEDIRGILENKFDLVAEKLGLQVTNYCERCLEKVADSAYQAAIEGHFWNKEMFKELMKETLYEMFFSQPEVHEEFKNLVHSSIRQIFSEWTSSSLSQYHSTEEYIQKMRKSQGKRNV